MSTQPIVAITLGDPAGTGPEIILKALTLPEVRALGRMLIVGDAATLDRAQTCTGTDLRIHAVNSPEQARFDPGVLDVLDLKNVDLSKLTVGKVSPMAGHAAYEYVKTAAELALAGRVGAIVTSALNKAALNAAGHHFDGHTGLLAEVCKALERP